MNQRWGFFHIEFGHRHTAVGIDKGLLVDAANAPHRADIAGVLIVQAADMMDNAARYPHTHSHHKSNRFVRLSQKGYKS